MEKKNAFKEMQEIIDKLSTINRKLKEHLEKNNVKTEDDEGAKILPFRKQEERGSR